MLALASCLAVPSIDALELDASFGTGGRVLMPRAAIVGANTQPAGAMVARGGDGYWWTMRDGQGRLVLGALDARGAPDPAIGAGAGRVAITPCANQGDTALLGDADGAIVAWDGRCLRRHRADGTADSGFGTGGVVDLGVLQTARLARDAEGRIVLAGSSGNVWFVHRVLAGGARDPAFGNDGVATPEVPSTNGFRALAALAVRDDGSIVVAGWRGNTRGPSLVLAGLAASGEADATFGVGGLVDVPHADDDATVTAQAMIAEADGAVVVTGERSAGSASCCLFVARYTRAGVLDPSIGLRTFALGGDDLPPFFEMRVAIAPARGGGWLVARTTFPRGTGNHRTQFTLVRVDATGVLDPALDGRGHQSWFVPYPATGLARGDYNQLHDTVFAGDAVAFFGRTFFEDDETNDDFITVLRVDGGGVFADGFESP